MTAIFKLLVLIVPNVVVATLSSVFAIAIDLVVEPEKHVCRQCGLRAKEKSFLIRMLIMVGLATLACIMSDVYLIYK